MSRPGVLTISLDFELHWGSRDHRALEGYRAQLLGGRLAVPKMLEAFEQREIHATWATVGLMFFESREELLAGLPERMPAYDDKWLSPYEALSEVGKNEVEDPFHFAPSLIARIAAARGQEIGSHTFSHYYCLESGQNAGDFLADLKAARELARRKLGIELKSLVFPRNQFNAQYVALCGEQGITAYRGNPRSWIYEPRARAGESILVRALRLADSYFNLSGHQGHAPSGASLPIDVPASRFLRPSSRKLALLEPLRLKRILDDLTYCARHGLLYHLWWHPDNFGDRQDENLLILDQVLAHFETLRREHGMQSLNMGEAATWMARS